MDSTAVLCVLVAVIAVLFPALRDSGFFVPKTDSAQSAKVSKELGALLDDVEYNAWCDRFPKAKSCIKGTRPFAKSDSKVPDAHYAAVIPSCPEFVPDQDLSRSGASPFVFRFTNITLRGQLLPIRCYGPVVESLIAELEIDPLFYEAFDTAWQMTVSSKARPVTYKDKVYTYNVYGYPPFRSIIDVLNFIQFDIINWIPLENQQLSHLNASKSMYIRLSQYYFLFVQAPLLPYQSSIYPHPAGEMPWLSHWMTNLTNEWGTFLNDDHSFPPIAMQYLRDSDADSRNRDYPLSKQFKLYQYKAPPGGYHSYNQWFGRNLKTGKRPVSASHDDTVVVTPCDSTYIGNWSIDEFGCIGLSDENITGPPNDRDIGALRESRQIPGGVHDLGGAPQGLKARKHVDACLLKSTISRRPNVKGLTYYSVQTLIRDAIAFNSSWANAFNGGTFMHMFLNVNDYHRLHVPVRGRVLYNNFTSENVYLGIAVLNESADPYVPPPGEKTKKPYAQRLAEFKKKSSLEGLHQQDSLYVHGVSADEFTQIDPTDNTGYQFYQSRGVVIIDSPIGLVATIPMGMAQVSLVTPTADIGDCARKGDEFSYFGIGGSDMVILVQKGVDFKLLWDTSLTQGHKYQGDQFATAKVDPDAVRRLGNCGL